MRKLVLLLCLAATLPACQQPFFDAPARDDGASERTRPEQNPDTTARVPDIYATAVVFPDSVDWRHGEPRGGRLLLCKNYEWQGGLPAGESLDPERHRVQEGHLWSDRTDGTRTYISCDGTQLFSIDGEESLQGFLLDGGSVHTLGQRPGGGIRYRVNGAEVFSAPTGTALGWASDPDWPGGALHKDGTDIWFTYGIPTRNGDSLLWEYRVLCGGQLRKVLPVLSGATLYDVRVRDGIIHRLEGRYGQLCLFQDETLHFLRPDEGIHDVKLADVDGNILAKGYSREDGGTRFWMQGADSTFFQYAEPHRTLFNLMVEQGVMAAVLLDGEGCALIARWGEQFKSLPPETYRLQNLRCAAFREGTLALALTHEEENDNILMVNGETHSMPFNGYFTGIYIE